MKKLLIVNPFGIGDVLFTTPVVRAIRENYPDSVIGYWCNERVSSVLKNNPRINQVFGLSRGDIKRLCDKSKIKGAGEFIKLFLSMRKAHFEVCLDFSLDHRYSLISLLLGIRRRIGFNYKDRISFLTEKIGIEGYDSRHMISYYLDLLGPLGLKPAGQDIELFISDVSKVRARMLLASSGVKEENVIVGLVPGGGASWGRDALRKHWPYIKFAQLADRLIEKFKAKVLLLGDMQDAPIADVITNAMKNKCVNLTGRTSLEELAALIANTDLLIANDGGPLHMGVALGKKTLSFFGPVDPVVYGPYPADEKRHVVLNKTIECSPCYRNFRLPVCERNMECLLGIDTEEAYKAASTLLLS